MGYKQTSKKYKATRKEDDSLLIDNKNKDDPNEPSILINPKVNGKRIGLDLSVILHKALACGISAQEMQCRPKIPVSKVTEACNKIISLARRSNITLAICTDGRYHQFKNSVNSTRKNDRMSAQKELDNLLRNIGDLDKNKSEIKRLMKKAVYVREDILAQAVEIFKENKVEVYGASHEADFQLVHWERTGFTHGTISVDSDIFMLGSNLFIDTLNVNSKLGNCKILEREEVMKQNAFTEESSKWSDDDLLVYGALCGCDWLPRLYRLQHKNIDEFMMKWIRTKTEEERTNLLKWISKGKHWPKGGGEAGTGTGELATDFPEKVRQCVNFAKYAPVIRPNADGGYEIGPLQDIPLTETKSWQELIGFDPRKGFQTVSIEDCYTMKVWSRTGEKLKALHLPKDPLDSTRNLPHSSIINFESSPWLADFLPTNVLLEWLYFHGLPMPKGSSQEALVEKVKMALANSQALDRERISLNKTISRKSYISWDAYFGVSNIKWTYSKTAPLDFLRDKISTVDEEYINTIFGLGKNGVRVRSWKRFQSGSLDISTLKMASATMDGEDEPVTIIEIKCTPSMKSEVYGVCLVFRSDGTYIHNKSKCDCPNGWLFCSHSLALFLLVRLIQLKADWTLQDLCDFMPQPIKTLQNLPIAACMVFRAGCHRKATKAIGKHLAKEVPGYSAAKDRSKDKDEKEESAILKSALEEKNVLEVKSLNMSKLLDDHLTNSKDAARIDKDKSSPNNNKQRKNKKKQPKEQKVTSSDIHKFNQDLVHSAPEPSRQCKKLLRHNRLQQMMDAKFIDDNNALSYHLRFFKDARTKELEEKRVSRGKVKFPDNFDKKFMEDYFKE